MGVWWGRGGGGVYERCLLPVGTTGSEIDVAQDMIGHYLLLLFFFFFGCGGGGGGMRENLI